MNFALVIDIGTTRIKHACISPTGEVACESTFIVPYASSEEESDIQGWFEVLVSSIDEIPMEIRASITAITVSGQGPSLVPIDRDNRVIRPLLFRWLLDSSTPVFRSYSQYIPFALAYIRKNPSLAQKVRYWVGIPEYIVYLLCGEWVAMLPSASYRRYYWTPAALRRAQLLPSQFPRYAYAGAVIATISARVAGRIGVSAGVPIISGGLDFYTAIIGAQCMQGNSVCDRAGSTEGVNIIGQPSRHHPLLQSYPLFGRRIANQSLIILNSGALLADTDAAELAQLRRALMNDASPAVADQHATTALPLLPELQKQGVVRIPQPSATHAQVAEAASRTGVAGRAPYTERLLQLEVLLFTIRYALELFPSQRRAPMTIALCGGQSRIAEWNALKADFLGVECRRFQCAHTELLGGAAIAFTALGVHRSLIKAVASVSHAATTYRPTAAAHQRFSTLARYQAFKQALDAFFEAIRDGMR